MMKLITLNIEANKHYNTIFDFFEKEKSDIMCLQEVLRKDFGMIKKRQGCKDSSCQHTQRPS